MPGLWRDGAEKKKKYSQFACHELNLFLRMRDRAFFDAVSVRCCLVLDDVASTVPVVVCVAVCLSCWRQVVVPSLRCKRALDFMDHWLLDHDLSVFTLYPNFVKLNAAEMALLCGRGMASTSRLAETLRSRVECAPSGAEAFDRLFRQAIAASALDTEGSAALEAVEAATQAMPVMDFELLAAPCAESAQLMDMMSFGAAMAPPPPGMAPPMAAMRAMPMSRRMAGKWTRRHLQFTHSVASVRRVCRNISVVVVLLQLRIGVRQRESCVSKCRNHCTRRWTRRRSSRRRSITKSRQMP